MATQRKPKSPPTASKEVKPPTDWCPGGEGRDQLTPGEEISGTAACRTCGRIVRIHRDQQGTALGVGKHKPAPPAVPPSAQLRQ